MGYVIKGLRKVNNELQTHVIRPDGNCGWEKIQGDRVLLKSFPGYDNPASIELPENHIARGKSVDSPELNMHASVMLCQSDIDQIAMGKYIDLSNAYMFDLNIHGDFCNANFKGAEIRSCELADADFINCYFKGAALSSKFRSCQFIHNNFTKASISGSHFTDTVFDCNKFFETRFKDVTINRFSVMKDNDFLRSRFHSVNLGHVDVRGENQHLNTIEFTGSTESEIANMKRQCLDALKVSEQEKISDLKLQEIDWDKVDKIYNYEVAQNVPTKYRVTEWFGDYAMAVPKPETKLIQFEQRYEEAEYGMDWKSFNMSYADAIEEVMNEQAGMIENPEMML